MTAEEAAAVLGPELTARLREQAAKAKPLTDQQIALLVGLVNQAGAEADSAAA